MILVNYLVAFVEKVIMRVLCFLFILFVFQNLQASETITCDQLEQDYKNIQEQQLQISGTFPHRGQTLGQMYAQLLPLEREIANRNFMIQSHSLCTRFNNDRRVRGQRFHEILHQDNHNSNNEKCRNEEEFTCSVSKYYHELETLGANCQSWNKQAQVLNIDPICQSTSATAIINEDHKDELLRLLPPALQATVGANVFTEEERDGHHLLDMLTCNDVLNTPDASLRLAEVNAAKEQKRELENQRRRILDRVLATQNNSLGFLRSNAVLEIIQLKTRAMGCVEFTQENSECHANLEVNNQINDLTSSVLNITELISDRVQNRALSENERKLASLCNKKINGETIQGLAENICRYSTAITEERRERYEPPAEGPAVALGPHPLDANYANQLNQSFNMMAMQGAGVLGTGIVVNAQLRQYQLYEQWQNQQVQMYNDMFGTGSWMTGNLMMQNPHYYNYIQGQYFNQELVPQMYQNMSNSSGSTFNFAQ